MRYALIADIHANLEALQAVLAAGAELGADRYVSLGDVVGYYADPNACIELLRRHGITGVRGNHDSVAAGLREGVEFSPTAHRAIDWTAHQLTPSGRSYLASLPLAQEVDEAFVAVHASLYPRPNESARIQGLAEARACLERMPGHYGGMRMCFFGHIHRCAAYVSRRGIAALAAGNPLRMEGDAIYLVNPGSVGQSRDGDPRAAFAIYDTAAQRVEFHRVAYDRELTLRKAAAAGLVRAPHPLVRRARQIKQMLRRLGVLPRPCEPMPAGPSA